MKKELYICNTYFHLLITMIKALNSKNKIDVVLASNRKDVCLCTNLDLIDRLKKACIFNDILIFNHSEYEIKYEKKKIRRYIYLIITSFRKEINFKNYDDIYIFYEGSLIGRTLNITRTYYNLIEDGTDFLKMNYSKIKVDSTLNYRIKSFVGYPCIGTSKYIKSIEVNDATDLPITGKKIIEMPKKKLFMNLTDEQKKTILMVFLPNGLNVDDFDNSSLIITQPLSEDHHLNSEKDKIKIYTKIINQYATDSKIVIKTHPRERTDYHTYFKDYTIIDFPFPLELINFFSIALKRAITVSSTSISLIENVKTKEVLGWDWLDTMKESDLNEKRK